MDTTVFFDLTKRGKWQELEEEWLKLVGNPPLEEDFYKKLISGMVKRNASERCDQMLGLLTQELADQGRGGDALKIARWALRRLTRAENLREAVITTLTKRYGDRENFQRFLDVSALRTDESVGKALTRFLRLLSFDVGEAYLHKTWGVGVVTAIDPAASSLKVRFAEQGETDFTLDGAREYLSRLPRNHFLARLCREPEKMKALADEKPAEFVKLAARSAGGGLRVSDLKRELSAYLMTDAEWRSWWNRSRDEARVDPYIAFSGSGLSAKITLRKTPMSVHAQAFEALREAETPRRRLDAARNWVRMSRKAPIRPEELQEAAQWVRNQIEETADDAVKVEMIFVLEQLRKMDGDLVPAPPATTADVVRACSNPAALVLALEVYDFQSPVLDAIHEAREDWLAVYEEVVPDLSVRLVSRAVAFLREGEHHATLRHISEVLLTDPRRNLPAHLWAVEQYLLGAWKQFAPSLSVEMTLERLLEHFTELWAEYVPRDEDGPAKRLLINNVRDFLKADDHKNARNAVNLMSEEGARRFYDRLQSQGALDSSELAHISAALRRERPELEEKVEEDLLTSAYHYVTKKVYDQRQAELERIRNVDIPANSERIGHAADQGDLSENAEYDAAKEEQARLASRMNELDDMLYFARVLDPDNIKTDRVWPGTRVRLRYEDGETDALVILGPWDADPDRNILSYRSPLGEQLLKRSVGDDIELTLPTGEKRRCAIESIENALA